MYYPYIRAKQYDLAGVINVDLEVYNDQKAKPIIEPAAKITNQYAKLLENDIPFVLVVNPIVGPLYSLTPNIDIVKELVHGLFYEYDYITLGFIIHPKTTLRQVQDFIENFPKFNHAFIHFSQMDAVDELAEIIEDDEYKELNIFIEGKVSLAYINEFTTVHTEDILIRDGFAKQSKNELYPDDSFFSDLHRTYEDELGYDGFGDFTIVGEQFSAGGGPAYVVALHLTNTDERNDIIAFHFKSDTTPPLTTANVAGKFGYALNKMNKYLRANPGLLTSGVTEYKILQRSGHYPGLGIPKQLSITHHIELVASLI